MSFGTVASAGDPLMQGLVGWYRMLGNANDSSGKGNTGTLVASPTAAADKYGNANSAYTFNGTSQYIALTQTSGLPVYTDGGSFSIAMWVKGASQYGGLFSEGSTGGNNPIFFTYTGIGGTAGPKFSSYVRNSAAAGYYFGTPPSGLTSTADVLNSSWNHIAVVYTSTTQQLYVNGSASGSGTGSAFTLGATLNRSTIGALIRSTTAAYFNGSLSDVRLYSRALTAADVGTLYRATQRI